MTGKRERYSAEFKTRVALDALRGELTTAQMATKHGIHQTMVDEWKKQAMAKSSEAEVEKLHAKIGQLAVEQNFTADCLQNFHLECVMPFDGTGADWNKGPAPDGQPGWLLVGLKKLAVTAATGCAVLLPLQQVASFAAAAVDGLLRVPSDGYAGHGISTAAMIVDAAVFRVGCVGFIYWGVRYWMDGPIFPPKE